MPSSVFGKTVFICLFVWALCFVLAVFSEKNEKEMKFKSKDEAIQHLADLTGKKIVIANNKTCSVQYYGNCVDSFDEDGESLIPIFENTTDFARQDENAKEITKDEFLKIIPKECIPKEVIQKIYWYPNRGKTHNILFFKYENDIFVLYDETIDIHFFFRRK